jgi:hypothetical protein
MLSDLEIHTLICKKDLYLASNNFKTLLQYEEFKEVPIFLHEDGSLNSSDKEFLKNSIKNVTIIDREYADQEIKKHIENYPHCRSYRLDDNSIHLWHKIKSFDYYFFSKTKQILGMDTDLLFLKKPESVLENIKNKIPFYFPDLQDAYCFNEPKEEIPVLKQVNTGLFYIPSQEFYNIGDIEFALSNLLRNGINYFPSWIEQSAYAHMFWKNGHYQSLPIEKYRIPYFQNVDTNKVECLHFVSFPAVRETYSRYLDFLKFKPSKYIGCSKNLVSFKEVKVPLDIKIYNDEEFLKFEFEWGLEKIGHGNLSHIFKIEIDGIKEEHSFGSESTGFFIIKKPTNSFTLQHTYDWYGETDWKDISIVYEE